MQSQINTSDRRRLGAGLLGATLLAAGGFADAQTSGFLFDASQLPETKGTVKQYTLTPRGDVDGLILGDGTEVKVPPHLSTQTVFAVRPGDAITVRGLKARALPLVAATTLRNDATGTTVTDDSRPRGDRDRPETLVTARVIMPLHGARGEVNGVLLDNNMSVRLPPPEAWRLSSAMQAGQMLSVRGTVNATPLGSAMDARAIGTSPDQLTYLGKPPKPPKPDKGPREARDDRDPRRGPAADVFAPPPPPALGGVPQPPPPNAGAPPPPGPGQRPPG